MSNKLVTATTLGYFKAKYDQQVNSMMIQQFEVNGTTDEYGRLFTNVDISSTVVISLLPYENGKIAQQVRLTSNKLCIKYTDSSSGSVYANQNVVCNVFVVTKYQNSELSFE